MLLEHPPELADSRCELFAVFWRMVEFGQQLSGGLVVVESLTNKVLQVLVLSEDRKEVLRVEGGEGRQFLFEFPEQPLPRFSRVRRGVDELGKEFIGACRTG